MSKLLLRTALAAASPGTDKAVLLLAGTAEARQLADLLVTDGRLRVISSLAGRTIEPRTLSGTVRIGGFGGVEGMASLIRRENVVLVVDATHPFAVQISANAAAAAKNNGVARVALVRPPWTRDGKDDWKEVGNLEEARDSIAAGSRVFLALGAQHIDVFAERDDATFIARMVDRPDHPPFANCKVITGIPDGLLAAEKAMLSAHRITQLVCRNSGGDKGFAKVAAATELGIRVIMIARPPPPAPPHLATPDEVMEFIDAAFSP